MQVCFLWGWEKDTNKGKGGDEKIQFGWYWYRHVLVILNCRLVCLVSIFVLYLSIELGG